MEQNDTQQPKKEINDSLSEMQWYSQVCLNSKHSNTKGEKKNNFLAFSTKQGNKTK